MYNLVGNIEKLEILNGYKEFINPVDYLNKKILLIGNKPIDYQLSEKYINLINSYDIIVRCNGMNNKFNTGNKVDWWWLNIWDWNVIKSNIGDTKYDDVSMIMVDKNSRKECNVNRNNLYLNFPKLKKDNLSLLYTNQISTELFDQRYYWVVNKSSGTVPTTDVICLSYLVNKLPFSKISLTCIDIEHREDLFKTHPNWSTTWHCNVGGLERDYIKSLIYKNKIKYVEFE